MSATVLLFKLATMPVVMTAALVRADGDGVIAVPTSRSGPPEVQPALLDAVRRWGWA